MRGFALGAVPGIDRKSTRLNSSHDQISYAVFCLKKKKHIFFLFPHRQPRSTLFPFTSLFRSIPSTLSRSDPVHAWIRSRRGTGNRSEEHTSELQSRSDLVCRLLLEKKKTHFFFISTPTTEIYALSLHVALPIYSLHLEPFRSSACVDSLSARYRE